MCMSLESIRALLAASSLASQLTTVSLDFCCMVTLYMTLYVAMVELNLNLVLKCIMHLELLDKFIGPLVSFTQVHNLTM